MEKRYDVFISYSTQDQKVVEGICGFLEREGYRCFVAYRDIPRGVVWATAITNALDASKMMVVVFSGAFNMSKQTDREIEIASENDMPILTFRVAEAQMTGAKKYYLKNLNWIDAFPNPESYFGRLLDCVVKLIGPSKIKPDKPVAVPPQSPKQSDTPAPKNKKNLWIALSAVAALVLLLVLLWPKKKAPTEPDTKGAPTLAELDSRVFQDCQTVADYRHYIAQYGQRAEHYAEAKDFIDRYVADSLQRVKDSLAQEEAQRQAQQQTEAEQAENEAYGKCKTVAACDKYLKDYPQGRYVAEVEAKKAELKAKVVSGTANGHEWVDLGLPSGTLWATCNVGASKPEDYGNYYAWGETSTKSTYNWSTYKYANGDSKKLTKYCSSSDYGNNGFTDNLITLFPDDDAAVTNWGSEWQTPSKAQWDELLSNTTNQWTTKNGVKGRLFTSKKSGQTLFLPAAGSLSDGESHYVGFNGGFWSRSLDTDLPYGAWYLYFSSEYCGVFGYGSRYVGFTVRPVRQK